MKSTVLEPFLEKAIQKKRSGIETDIIHEIEDIIESNTERVSNEVTMDIHKNYSIDLTEEEESEMYQRVNKAIIEILKNLHFHFKEEQQC